MVYKETFKVKWFDVQTGYYVFYSEIYLFIYLFVCLLLSFPLMLYIWLEGHYDFCLPCPGLIN